MPQGRVLSLALFNTYMSSMPTPPQNIEVVSYADDITIMASGVKPATLCGPLSGPLSAYQDQLYHWMQECNLRLSAEKSTITLFTKWTKKVRSQFNITVDGHQLLSSQTTKVLGVTLEPLLTFSQHITNSCKKIGQLNNIHKKLAGLDWGCTKEVLLSTYKAIGRSVMNYASHIWTPSPSDSCWRNLQVKQNAALRMVTRCLVMTSVPHIMRPYS